jgi:hypothetical protein
MQQEIDKYVQIGTAENITQISLVTRIAYGTLSSALLHANLSPFRFGTSTYFFECALTPHCLPAGNFLSDDKSGLSLCRSCGNQFSPYQLHPHTQTVTTIHLYLSHLVSICFLTLNRVS